MDILKKFFPASFNISDLANFIVRLIVYVVAAAVVSILAFVLSFIPVLNVLLSIVSWLVGLYCTIGIVLTILVYCKVLK